MQTIIVIICVVETHFVCRPFLISIAPNYADYRDFCFSLVDALDESVWS
ncbi:MAG: hypothetical protein LBC68_08655 [Prevotellaceae bacterium]|nr:hypothetical protein [Prevotellaceae bacterium]